MQFTGKITQVLELQSGQGRNGEWRRQSYILEYDSSSQYPRRILFDLWGERISQFNIQLGGVYTVDIDFDVREYNGRHYNDVRAWRVTPASTPSQATAYAAPENVKPVVPQSSVSSASEVDYGASSNEEDDDDLPF